jgi:phospholipase C
MNPTFRLSRWITILCLTLTLAACGTPVGHTTLFMASTGPAPTATTSKTANQTPPAAQGSTPTTGKATPQQLAPTHAEIPNFSHIIIIVMENKDYKGIIGNAQMPSLNQWAKEYTQLSAYYAITHPSLPNYLAMIGGDTFGITTDCTNCFLNQPNLADVIEASGRKWRTYQEDIPSPCFVGNKGGYAQKHNPFIYFDSIRNNPDRCRAGVVSLNQLPGDLSANTLPDFAFVMPNLCNSSHDCTIDVTDAWLNKWVNQIMKSPAYDANTLIVLTFDEGLGNKGCCGLDKAGGRVATILISPSVRRGFVDDTPYTHYSLLKTISAAWGMPPVGHAADAQQVLIRAPFAAP